MSKLLRTLLAVLRDLGSYVWPLTKRNNLIRAVILVGLIFAGMTVLRSEEPVAVTEETQLPVVFVGTAASIQAGTNDTFIGTVRAVSEAQIQSEVGGRVTSVAVRAGDQVGAGAVIATLENASQRAAVLQAEGSYESALAAAAQSDVSVEDAQNSLLSAQNAAVSAYRSAYTTVNGVVFNTLDQFFADPTGVIVGVRINTGNTQSLASARKALQTTLPAWSNASVALTQDGDVEGVLTNGIADTNEVIALLDSLLAAVSNADQTDTLDGAPVTSYTNTLTTARSSLVGALTSLESGQTTITAAEEGLRRAQIGATGNDVSAADAQVKSALGTLRSAQAALAKTILRSPIAGTVNTVTVNQGDFIGAFTQVAEVANNDALEISIFVGENDLATLAVGDTVTIEGGIVGTVSNVAPAIDPATLKTEVRIGAESNELINGATVTVTTDATSNVETAVRPILVPLTAVKFTATDGNMFFVEDGQLVDRPVTIGAVRGSNIEILEGLLRSEEFILDARGLTSGTAVEVRVAE